MLGLWILLLALLIVAMMVAQFLAQRRALAARTLGYYVITATHGSYPGVDELRGLLGGRGYQLNIEQIDAVAPYERAYVMRDHRFKAKAGKVTLQVRLHEGSLRGELESTDSGPEFYEELARYAIAELAKSVPTVRFARPGDGSPRRASELADELPNEPLGMSMLPT